MLFAYPESTRVGRSLPKNAIYKNVALNAKQREQLTQQVEKITWAHKLAPDTLNIKASAELPEIQVFQIQLKPEYTEIAESLLHYLDKAIPSALIFEVQSTAGVQTAACYKQHNPNGSVKYSPYLFGALMPADAERQTLPISRDFARLHQHLLAQLMPIQLKADESLAQGLERLEQLTAVSKTVEKLEAQLLNKNTQFNKRVELNQQLKSAKSEQAALLGE